MYVIYDLKNEAFVTRRKNASYELFTKDIKHARFYKNYKNAETFAKQIYENNKLLNADLRIVKISYRELIDGAIAVESIQ